MLSHGLRRGLPSYVRSADYVGPTMKVKAPSSVWREDTTLLDNKALDLMIDRVI